MNDDLHWATTWVQVADHGVLALGIVCVMAAFVWMIVKGGR